MEGTQEACCWLALLPENVLELICREVDAKDLLLGLAPSCTHFRRIILQHYDSLWRSLCQLRWGGDDRILNHHIAYYHNKAQQPQQGMEVEREGGGGVVPCCFWLQVFKREVEADVNWKEGRLTNKRETVNGGQRKIFRERKILAKWERRPMWGWLTAYTWKQSIDVSPHFIATFGSIRKSGQR